MGKLGRGLAKGLKDSFQANKSWWEIHKDKPFFRRVLATIYMSDNFDWIHDKYTDLTLFVYYRPKARIERLWFYAKHIWTIGEWDHSWHTKLWYLSMCRLHDQMLKGHCVVSKKKARKMRIARELLKRISDKWKYYEEPHSDYFYKRWGSPEFYFKDASTFTFKGSTMHNAADERLTNRQKHYQQKERKRMYKHEQYMFKQDVRMLCKILETDLYGWWD